LLDAVLDLTGIPEPLSPTLLHQTTDRALWSCQQWRLKNESENSGEQQAMGGHEYSG
jgi:hypothetical protein